MNEITLVNDADNGWFIVQHFSDILNQPNADLVDLAEELNYLQQHILSELANRSHTDEAG